MNNQDPPKSIEAAPAPAPRLSYMDLIFQEGFKDKNSGRLPLSLGVEVTNHCNLRCPMCPREIADRGFGNMDFDLYKLIVDQVKGERVVFLPQGFGESFIHPRFGEMLHYAHDNGILATMVVTNATYLNAKNIDTLIDAQVPLVNVSLDGPRKEVYEAIRVNADFDKVVHNVQELFRRRDERNSKLPHIILRMIRMQETEPYVAEFETFWKPYLKEGDEIVFSVYQTWNNTVSDRRVEEPAGLRAIESLPGKPPCRMIYKTMQVYYDGRTTPCCYDYNCTMEIGNARTESLEAIWSGERAQQFRRIHEEGRMEEIPICRNCQEYIP